MPTEILMPALSPTMTEGKLARWIKKTGETVRAGDVIAEIETDKATMEVEAADDGTLARILVDEGTDGIAVNTPIALLDGDGVGAPETPQATAPQTTEAAREKKEATPDEAPVETEAVTEPKPAPEPAGRRDPAR